MSNELTISIPGLGGWEPLVPTDQLVSPTEIDEAATVRHIFEDREREDAAANEIGTCADTPELAARILKAQIARTRNEIRQLSARS